MKSAYQSLECIFPRWKCSKFETSEFVLDMVLKVSQTKFYRIPPEKKRQTFSFKKNFSTFKNFHFERNVLISRLNAFFQGENAQILKLLNFCSIGFKSFGNEIFSYSLKQEATKHVVSKKILTFKNFHFGRKVLISRLNAFFQGENAQNLKLLNLYWIWS